MDWFGQVIFFGCAAAVMFALSVASIKSKKYIAGLVFGILELLAAEISSVAWAYALRISGKIDWFLLGLKRYTPMALICYAMFAAGILCVVINSRGIIKRSGRTKQKDKI